MVPRKGTIFLILCIGISPCSFPDLTLWIPFLIMHCALKSQEDIRCIMRIEEKNTVQCMLILNA